MITLHETFARSLGTLVPLYARSQEQVKGFSGGYHDSNAGILLQEGVVDTVMRGGDTDTNAAICGALLGAVYGREAIPDQWVERVLNCRPAAGLPHVHHPRPECFWPVDALELAERLVSSSGDEG